MNTVKQNTFVFVYGTLMAGGGLHGLLERSAYVGDGTIGGRIYDLGSYPGWIADGVDSSERVHGEVYRVDGETLQRLDTAEGVSSGLYERRSVAVTVTGPSDYSGARSFPVWAYHYGQPLYGRPQVVAAEGAAAKWNLTRKW
jgi:gamma-glutamylcyclotransferase (GGCT)/AIG2-like uncharacterized protein YtfP